MIVLKTRHELDLLREANRIVAVILEEIAERIRPGVTTLELDQWAEARILELNARPGFKGYGGFPATLCTSVNEEVVHGIPSPERVLQEGDIVGIDVGSIYAGYYGDGARTYAVGEVSAEARQLMAVCRESLGKGIEAAVAGNRISDISLAIDRCVRPHGFEIVRDLTGHGIGRQLHEEPQILNYDCGRSGPRIKPNMTLAIEPMITAGTWEVRTLADQWTVVTADGSLAAHFEHTVAVTDNGPEILTRL
ncbi:MAG: type I methionyl aminopeptidase [Acidobacteriota bacterium]|jgi:methionyl aminopeptidase|nr:type I methionyl aminopeptidase [Acidobacteriota bacterium]